MPIFNYAYFVTAALTGMSGFLEAAEAMKREILRLYVQDIGKYAKGYAPKVRAIFRHIPGALNSKEKKFRLSDLGEKVAPDLAYSSPRGLSPRIVMCLTQRRRDAEKRHKETVGRSVLTRRLRLLGQRASCQLE